MTESKAIAGASVEPPFPLTSGDYFKRRRVVEKNLVKMQVCMFVSLEKCVQSV